ncbi:GMC oxidoreductase [Aspergillus heteromorphus CBS 117.55]|uniref:GMC oxidoreductase n=1 Tax=Aspergillus heteromorphus CBS 117.55 TaxID=1448321 RepID=A0A317X2C7_9EURO|nr:GMC oxidoreductase [Aspergillus heteromorphus CBS 117.55]PWY92716.1 GMC oxidoreductase [Aspergillus heteromorphus CBS 117.55]
MLIMRVLWSILGLAALVSAQDGLGLNLFDYGQRGPLLGTWMGIPGEHATFDYIVIGGGTAGLTVASRLAQSGNLTVAVVEAGGFYEIESGDLSVIPGHSTYFAGPGLSDYQPLVDWGVRTQLQQTLGNRVVHYARGKTLGGCSGRNYMFYHRPTRDSLHRWAEQANDSSYDLVNIAPYYMRSVHFTPPDEELFENSTNIQNPDAFSSTGGPLEVSSGNFVDTFGTWLRTALLRLGLNQTEFNSGRLLGSGYLTMTINPANAHRSSSATSFLQASLRSRDGPVVYTKTLTQKILFDISNVATGVQVQTAGTFGTPSINFTLSARREIILSAGAIQSPQLLMVSGIGSCHYLSQFNITCISHLPGVGENLQDHPRAGVIHRVYVPTAGSYPNATVMELAIRQYIEDATGPMSIVGPGYFGFEKLPNPYRGRLSNDSLAALATLPGDWPETIYTADGFNPPGNNSDGYIYATISFSIIAPFSRGSISLAGPDMTTPPIIDPQWLADPTDMELMIATFRRSRLIWQELVQLGVAHPEEYSPGINVTTDEQIREFLQRTLTTLSHASSTCKMGQQGDPLAVLDSSARVYGVRGLRVVDASSFPFLPPGYPQATVYALAEKIADRILQGQ